MFNLIKKINKLPIKLTIKHYFLFGESGNLLKDKKLDSVESWEVLRVKHPHFSISSKREEWLRACELEIKKDGQDRGLIKRAKDVVGILEKINVKTIFSVGVGGAGLEYQIKKIRPDIRLICSEYSQLNVDLLKSVFWECDSIILFDIKNGDWKSILGNYGEDILILIYRVDASLTDLEWKRVFQEMFDAGVQNILYIPSGFLTILSLFYRFRQRLWWKITNKEMVFAGYLRTEKTFKDYWKSLYDENEIITGGLKSFLLKKKM